MSHAKKSSRVEQPVGKLATVVLPVHINVRIDVLKSPRCHSRRKEKRGIAAYTAEIELAHDEIREFSCYRLIR